MKWLVIALLVGTAAPSLAKKSPPKTSGNAKKPEKKTPPPPPNDKGANDGAQGRRNATEDAARGAENPNDTGRRP